MIYFFHEQNIINNSTHKKKVYSIKNIKDEWSLICKLISVFNNYNSSHSLWYFCHDKQNNEQEWMKKKMRICTLFRINYVKHEYPITYKYFVFSVEFALARFECVV
jgi:hypothetical protein